jgi:hypothetical protein
LRDRDAKAMSLARRSCHLTLKELPHGGGCALINTEIG